MVRLAILLLLVFSTYAWTVEYWTKFSYPFISNGTDAFSSLNLTTYANLTYKEIIYTDTPSPPLNVSIFFELNANSNLTNNINFAVVCMAAYVDTLKV